MIEGFNEIFNKIYIAKKLYDLGKYELVTYNFSDIFDYDLYYSDMLDLMSNLFDDYYCRYYEYRGFELHILSDPVIEDFYILAGKYGRHENISDNDNPYLKAANKEVNDNLTISHELDWALMGHTEPKRPFHSRLALFISCECGCLDIGVLVYRLIEIYEWFANKCVELRELLDNSMGGLQIFLSESVDMGVAA